MLNLRKLCAGAMLTTLCTLASTPAFSTVVSWTNGHNYEVVRSGPISWADARSAARSRGFGWDLATITSAGEQFFIAGEIGTPPAALTEFYIGGFYDNGWQWVTGENFNTYTYWGNGEPNGNALEPFLALDNRYNIPNWGWNDYSGGAASFVAGYVAEQSQVSEPGVVAMFALGLFGISLRSRRRRT